MWQTNVKRCAKKFLLQKFKVGAEKQEFQFDVCCRAFQWRFCRRHVGSWWMAGASRRRSSSKPMEPLPGTQPSIGDQWMEKLHLPLNRIFVDISFKGPHPPKLQSLGHFYIDENITWASIQAPHIPEKNCMELIIIFWGVVHTDCATAGTGLLASCSCWQSNQCGSKQVSK